MRTCLTAVQLSRRRPQVWAGALAALLLAPLSSGPTLDVEVDARDLPRRLLHARITVPTEPGTLALWYPKWVPGIHAPKGPVENVGGLRVETIDGETIPWHRDDEELHRVECEIPEGVDRVAVSLDYICNQPSTNSRGVDSYANGQVGVVNWNTCLLYPEGFSAEEIAVRLRLALPAEWRFATALPGEREDDGWIRFEPESLYDVIDSPLIAGEHLRTADLSAGEFPPVWLHLATESPQAIQFDDELIGQYRALVREAAAMFGHAPFEEYHFLLTCSDELPNTGLEHHSSSLNGVGERDLVDEEDRAPWAVYLLPHEFVHAWCGKYRRPAGMATPDYHTPKHTELLWVYEGMTQYLGEILAVRSGLFTAEEWRERLALKISWLMHVEGRRWRSLEDTAVSNYHLRGGSPNWQTLRRGQDYYNEGLLLWLEVDAIIHEMTDGRRSLDDLCRQFFGSHPSGERVVPYELDEVIGVLAELADHDWEQLFAERAQSTQEELSLDFVQRCGYRLQYANEPSEYLKEREEDRGYVHMLDSVGVNFGDDGHIWEVVPGLPGDDAGLAPGMKVEGVNGRRFSRERIVDAVADSVTTREIEFLALEGDRYRTLSVTYGDGPRYLQLLRDEGRPDILSDILEPRAGE